MAEQKRQLCIALFNAELRKVGICPGNHEVYYDRGWFFCDGRIFHRPDITGQADLLIKKGQAKVRFSPQYNTYVLTE